MSGDGAPVQQLPVMRGKAVAIVAAQWHEEIMDGLLAGALRATEQARVTTTVLRVPGTFELGVAVSRAARSGHFDAVVALGVVIRGGTPHFDFVCHSATQALTSVAVDTGIPVGFGVLTCDTTEQARDRAGLSGSAEDKGFEATHAALSVVLTLREAGM